MTKTSTCSVSYRRRSLAAITATLACVLSSDAVAQPNRQLSDASAVVFEEAVNAAGKKDWAVCRTKAAGVWDQEKNTTVAALLGACEEELGMHREAAEHLDFFLQRDKGDAPVQTKVAKENFEKARKHVAIVDVTSTPSEAEVWVDGGLVGKTPARIFAKPGGIAIELRKPGFVTKQSPILGSAGEQKAMAITLDQEAGTGGGGAGAGGYGGAGGAGGNDGGAGGSGGATTSDKAIWPAILLGGLGAAGLATGIGLTVTSAGKHDDAETAIQSCEPLTQSCITDSEDLLSESSTHQNIGIAGYAIGGAALIGMAVYLLIPPPGPPSSGVHVVPIVTSDTQGILITGSF